MSYIKRAAAVLLSLMVMIVYMPVFAFAETESADGTSKGKQEPATVSDESGELNQADESEPNDQNASAPEKGESSTDELSGGFLPESEVDGVASESEGEVVAAESDAEPETTAEAESAAELEEDTEPTPVSKLRANGSVVVSGECGVNASWALDSDGVLTVSGSGEMTDFEYSPDLTDNRPWCDYIADITGVIIESGITTVGANAFRGCSNLQEVSLPDGMTDIKSYAFYGCSKLSSVNIPSGLTVISNAVFAECNLTEIIIPDGITNISSKAFAYNPLTSITIPDSVKYIGQYAFEGCDSLTSVTAPLIDNAFGYTSDDEPSPYFPENTIKELTITGNLTVIAGNAFNNDICKGITTLTIPETVTSIGNGAFQETSLTSFVIPDRVRTIGAQTFYNCSALKTIELPSRLNNIGDAAFQGSGLTGIDLPATLLTIGENAFRSTARLKISSWVIYSVQHRQLRRIRAYRVL